MKNESKNGKESMKDDAVIVPLITPKSMTDFFSLIEHVLEGGVTNLLLFGTTGEGQKIEFETKKTMLEQLVPFIQNRARLYIALFGPSLTDLVTLANFCSDLGFAGAFLPLVFTNERQLLAQLLEKTRINYYLYNTPSLPTTEIRDELFKTDRIIGIKDSSGNIEFVQSLVSNYKREGFKIYYGRERHIEKALSLGVDGIIPGAGNIQPNLALRLWGRRDEESFESFQSLKKQIDQACPGNYLQGLKNLLLQQGIIRS